VRRWTPCETGTLTTTEWEVVALVGEGFRNEQIARRLYVNEKMVRHNLTVIYDKLGVSNRLEPSSSHNASARPRRPAGSPLNSRGRKLRPRRH
jgi:DNA-binding CsgD family transcriptional regulator